MMVAALFLGALPLPYGYYTLLRLVATCFFIWCAVIAHNKNNNFLFIFIILALLFNPIFKVYFPKELWSIIDVTVGLFVLSTKSKILNETS